MSHKEELISNDTERLEDAVEDALTAFWKVVAKKYPEIKSGDLSPETVFSLDSKLKEVVKLWLDGNQD